MSPCCRNKFGAVIVNPITNSIVSEGYNGLPRGCEGSLCGGKNCERNLLKIESGTHLEVGCHHAEANSITNASRLGVKTDGCWLFVNGEPCLACAKLIHHSGITKVFFVKNRYSSKKGIQYLKKYKVDLIETPK